MLNPEAVEFVPASGAIPVPRQGGAPPAAASLAAVARKAAIAPVPPTAVEELGRLMTGDLAFEDMFDQAGSRRCSVRITQATAHQPAVCQGLRTLPVVLA